MPEAAPRRALLGKAISLALCLAFALVAFGNGYDRLAAVRPSVAAKVPAFFADHALVTRASAEIDSGQYDAALRDGRRALLRAPLDPASSALYGAARFGLDDPVGAQRAFIVAGQMGWRMPLTQLYWMNRAVEVSDYRVAALRLDALLRQYPWMLGKAEFMAPLESSAEGRAAIADRLRQAPSWLTPYASEVAEIPPTALLQRAQVLHLLAANGQSVGCDASAPLVNSLVNTGHIAEGHSLWREQCPESGTGLVSDPGFAILRMTGARSYFDWDVVGNDDVAMVLAPGTGKQGVALHLHNDAAAPRTILRQLLAIPPGRYRLQWSAETPAGAPAGQALASVACSPNPAPPMPARAAGASTTWQADFAVGSDCPAHWLIFAARAGGGEWLISNVRVDRAD